MDKAFAELVDPSRSAVIVIDIQNDSCHPDGMYARLGKDISLRQAAGHRAAQFIKDVRPLGVPIIFFKFNQNAWNQSAAWMRRDNPSGKLSCIEGTWGEALYAVEPMPGELVLTKHRYSAFIGTDFEMALKSRGITTLILTGGGTGACVESTARDGFMLDYDIIVVADCCGTTSLSDHEPALTRMANLCATVVQSQELLEIWSKVGVQAPAISV